jgi:hypothetical protein
MDCNDYSKGGSPLPFVGDIIRLRSQTTISGEFSCNAALVRYRQTSRRFDRLTPQVTGHTSKSRDRGRRFSHTPGGPANFLSSL